jgi:DNA polymerase-3 subunit delta'
MIVPLFGHHDVRERLEDSLQRGSLPASLLLQGLRGIGKQRLALWIGQRLLCQAAAAPCNTCQGCRFALGLKHPDLHWYFPRPRLKDTDPDLDDIRADYGEAVQERSEASGLYAPPSGSEGIYIATVRAIVQQAVLSPVLGKRKVFVIGDAERMVPQEGSEQAANAFLKLLEEPPSDTTIVLTSSEPGALLPTIRSRVIAIRVPRVADEDVRAFVSDEMVVRHLSGDESVPGNAEERVRFAAGAPGRLLAAGEWATARDNARRLLDAATGKPAARYEAAWGQASSKARGSFAETLDALTVELHERARDSVERGSNTAALGASRALEVVEVAKERVASNVSPQLITVNLIRELQGLLS